MHGSWSVAAAYERTRAPFILREIPADRRSTSKLANEVAVLLKELGRLGEALPLMRQCLAGAKIKYMNSDEQQQARGGGSGGGGGSKSSGSAGMVILAIILPIGLPFLALFYCYWAASKEGLGDVLAMLRKKRDRSAKRRGTKAGGNFRQRQKTSQDGKGGRSANS